MKSAEELTSILDHLRDQVRPQIARIAGPRSCLQTCAVVEKVLNAHGYQTQTLGVVLQIFNDVCAEQAIAGEEIDVKAEGAWARQIGRGPGLPTPEGWEGAGHTVNIVPEYGLLIDLSLDQVNDGHEDDPAPRDINALPFYCEPPLQRFKDFRWGRKPLSMVGDSPDGRPYLVTYIGVPGDKSYLTAQTYNDPLWAKLADLVVSELE